MFSQFMTPEEAFRRRKIRKNVLYYIGIPLLAILGGAIVAFTSNSLL